MCDVADDYLVSDVFDESPIVYAAMPGLTIPLETAGTASNDPLLSPNDSIASSRHYLGSLTKRRRYTLTSLRITDSPSYSAQHTPSARSPPNRRGEYRLNDQGVSPETPPRVQNSNGATLPPASPELLPFFKGTAGECADKEGQATFAMSRSEAWARIESQEHSSPALTCLPMQPSSPSPDCGLDAMPLPLPASMGQAAAAISSTSHSLRLAHVEANQPASAGTTVTSTPVVPAATIVLSATSDNARAAGSKPSQAEAVLDSKPLTESLAYTSACAASTHSESSSSEKQNGTKDAGIDSADMNVDKASAPKAALVSSASAGVVSKDKRPTPPGVAPATSTPATVVAAVAAAAKNAPVEAVATAMAALQTPSAKPETENSSSGSSDDASDSGSETGSESETDSESGSEDDSESDSSEEESDSAALNTIRALAGKATVESTASAAAKLSITKVAVARPPPAIKGATKIGDLSIAPSVVLKQKAQLKPASNSSDSSDDLDSDIASDSETKRRPKPPALTLPSATRRSSGLLDLAKSQKSALGRESPGIMSISQMASAKPYDELRKTMAKIAAARVSQSIPPTPSTALPQTPRTAGIAPNKDSSESESESDSSSDSDSSSGSSSDSSDDEDITLEVMTSQKATADPAKRNRPIRFAGATTPSASARARRRKSALLSL
ncbi:hypothetical protein GGI00_001460 [Coemansia sp. RSA 2681]|nr:hypothetical protein GGI00_001460 [Coemansia sp. RSA 2681]